MNSSVSVQSIAIWSTVDTRKNAETLVDAGQSVLQGRRRRFPHEVLEPERCRKELLSLVTHRHRASSNPS